MAKQTQFDHGYALLVGVGADLPVTASDALGLRELLVDETRCAIPQKNVRLLTETEARRDSILDGLDWLASQSQQDRKASVIFYFSGHGGFLPHYHLVPYGYSRHKLATTAVSGADLTARIQAIQSQKLLVLLDCCHAGGMASVKSPHFTKSSVPPDLVSAMEMGSGRVLIASSRKDEVSWTGHPYSVFTQALLEGLAGYGSSEKDGYARVTDVALYVGRVVPQRTQEKQHPLLRLSKADDFTLSFYAAGEKSPKVLTGGSSMPQATGAGGVKAQRRYRKILGQYKTNLLVVEERMAQFIDQAAVPPDLLRAKEEILRKVVEIQEQMQRESAKST